MKATKIEDLTLNEVYLLRIEGNNSYYYLYGKFKGINSEKQIAFCHKDNSNDDLTGIFYYNSDIFEILGTYEENNNNKTITFIDFTEVCYNVNGLEYQYNIQGNQVEKIVLAQNNKQSLFLCKNINGIDWAISLQNIISVNYIPLYQSTKYNSNNHELPI